MGKCAVVASDGDRAKHWRASCSCTCQEPPHHRANGVAVKLDPLPLSFMTHAESGSSVGIRMLLLLQHTTILSVLVLHNVEAQTLRNQADSSARPPSGLKGLAMDGTEEVLNCAMSSLLAWDSYTYPNVPMRYSTICAGINRTVWPTGRRRGVRCIAALPGSCNVHCRASPSSRPAHPPQF